jgi:hypothetical protein
MVLTTLQRNLLRNELERAVSGRGKWHAVLMVFGLGIGGIKLVQDCHIKHKSKYVSKEYAVKEVVLRPESCVFFLEAFYDTCVHTANYLCHFQRIEFNFDKNIPKLKGKKLFLGHVSGYGPENFFIDLSKKRETRTKNKK